jgi:hypothetical protein
VFCAREVELERGNTTQASTPKKRTQQSQATNKKNTGSLPVRRVEEEERRAIEVDDGCGCRRRLLTLEEKSEAPGGKNRQGAAVASPPIRFCDGNRLSL